MVYKAERAEDDKALSKRDRKRGRTHFVMHIESKSDKVLPISVFEAAHARAREYLPTGGLNGS
jgi:hypothetical protein